MQDKEERRLAILDIFHKLKPDDRLLGLVTASSAPLPGPDVVYERLSAPKSRLIIIDQPTDLSDNLYVQGTTQPPPGWESCFNKAGPSLWEIWGNLQNKGKYLPKADNVFLAFRMIRPEDIKVVIIGQDPYPQVIDGRERATGLAFSQHRWDRVSSSLSNIYKEIYNCYPEFVNPGHGDLTAWCSQGVMLLNTCLTVTEGHPGSHGNMWLGFINAVIQHINDKSPHAVFVLWGAKAQKLSEMISPKSLQLTSSHPSGLSAYRGFLGSKFALEINDHLTKKGLRPINWQL